MASDAIWSRLRTAWRQISYRKGTRITSPTAEIFSERFDRCYRRVALYVSRRVKDGESFQRIVTQVLHEHLELLLAQYDDREEATRLKASADRLIALEAATRPGVRTSLSPRPRSVGAAQRDQPEWE